MEEEEEWMEDEESWGEESRAENGNSDNDDDDDDDDSTSVFDILDYEAADVWGEVLEAIHLMQEGAGKFQAGLSPLKIAIQISLWLP